jgi:hypothetical protein
MWDNEYCALKQISKSLVVKSQLINHIKAEKRIMSECDSPFLVHLRASFQDSQYLYLLMDFVQVCPLSLQAPLPAYDWTVLDAVGKEARGRNECHTGAPCLSRLMFVRC